MSGSASTAAFSGLISCQACGMVSRKSKPALQWRCPRCAAILHSRKVQSVQRAWAFLIAAYILYIPANLLPIMTTATLSAARTDTIMSGIVSLWNSGSWGIAVVVFVASIVVPLLKLIVLTILLVSVQLRSRWRPDRRARLYRLLGVVGRWSMLDIFVAAILTSLVQFRLVATVTVGSAAIPFGAVVVLTILAALCFDPRLIWDSLHRQEDRDE